MDVKITSRLSRNKLRLYYTVKCGSGPGQRKATGIYTFTSPATTLEKHHNKEALHLLEIKRSQLLLDKHALGTGTLPLLDKHALGTGTLPSYRLKANFLDFYEEFVRSNRKSGKRHLVGSIRHFKSFLKRKYLAPIEINEDLCSQFRKYLLDHFNGDTPANYFSRFKKVVKAATRQGYFRYNPVEEIPARGNRNKIRKDHRESDEYIQLLKTPCFNQEVKEAFIFCCYTGMRWCDLASLQGKHIILDGNAVLIAQQKTKAEHFISLHPIAQAIINKRKSKTFSFPLDGQIFQLPSADGANKILRQWCHQARIHKNITWNCARLSFSILLQDANVNASTVALLLGHTSSKYVDEIYKRYKPKDQSQAINQLPEPEMPPYFLGFTI